MRVLVASDQVVETLYSPAVRDIARGVELILSSGDLPSAYLEYLVSTLDVPLLYVMGNHGSTGGSKEFPEGGENIDGRVVESNGLLIAGLEGSIRYNDSGKFQYTEAEMRAKIAALSPALWMNKIRHGRYLDILLTHSPPFGIQDGRDRAHQGFKSFLWVIDHYRPDYLIHGHLHIYDRRVVTQSIRGHTLVINAYGYKILEINTKSNLTDGKHQLTSR
jgi:Icc-related predicted phosphoesterase